MKDLHFFTVSRFIDQPKDVQSVTLRVINQLVLSEVDVVDGIFDVTTQPHHSRKIQGSRFKSMKQSPGRSDSGFSASDVNVAGLLRDLNKDERPNWTCLSQYCVLLSSKDTAVAVEVMKSLKTLATLGSKFLKEELFRMVVLPCILRGDGVFTEDIAEPLQKIRERSANGWCSSDWKQKKGSFSGDRSVSPVSNGDKGCLSHEANVAENDICEKVLELCMSCLPSLLRSSTSRELFFNCGGLNEMQCFLALPELQQPVLRVLEFLVNIENWEDSRRTRITDKGELAAGSPETFSEEKTDRKICCRSFLSLLQYSTLFVEKNDDSDQLPPKAPKMASCHPVEASLRVHIWKSCLHLLVSNESFCELFLKGNGEVCSYDLLCNLIDWFQEAQNDSAPKDDVRGVKYVVSLFESVLPICIRLAHTNAWKDREVRSYERCLSFYH